MPIVKALSTLSTDCIRSHNRSRDAIILASPAKSPDFSNEELLSSLVLLCGSKDTPLRVITGLSVFLILFGDATLLDPPPPRADGDGRRGDDGDA